MSWYQLDWSWLAHPTKRFMEAPPVQKNDATASNVIRKFQELSLLEIKVDIN